MSLKQFIKHYKHLYGFVIRLQNIKNKISFKKGRNNQIRCKGIKILTKIQIKGHNNLIKLESGALLNRCKLYINGNNNLISIGRNTKLDGVEIWIEDNSNKILLGNNINIGHHSHLACIEGTVIQIKDNCLFSSYVQVRTGDSHSILDCEGRRINPSQSVIIEDHCWIGQGVKILKGAQLGTGSVVATGSIITSNFTNNSLIGGIPAKVLKSNVDWSFQRI